VGFDDGLTNAGTVLQVSGDRLTAILADVLEVAERVETGRAAAGGSAKAAAGRIALLREVLAEARRGQDGAQPLQRGDALLVGERVRLAMVDKGFPAPVETRDGPFEASQQVVGGDVGAGGPIVRHQA